MKEAVASKMIFVSYSRDDQALVDRLLRRMVNAGYDIWIDREDITAGDQWRRQIVEAIETSSQFVVALSRNSVKSDNVRKELDLAEGVNAKIVPVFLEPVSVPAEMRYQLAGLQQVNLADDFEIGFGRLSRALGPPPEEENVTELDMRFQSTSQDAKDSGLHASKSPSRRSRLISALAGAVVIGVLSFVLLSEDPIALVWGAIGGAVVGYVAGLEKYAVLGAVGGLVLLCLVALWLTPMDDVFLWVPTLGALIGTFVGRSFRKQAKSDIMESK